MKNYKSMFKFTPIVFAIGFLVAGDQVVAKQQDELPDAMTVLKKYVEVTGGVENYKKVKTMKMTGSMAVNNGIKGTLESVRSMPDKSWSKAELDQLGAQTRGTDGKVGWDISVMTGPRILQKEELQQLKDEGNLAHVYDPESHFKEMKVVGVEEFEKEKCYKLALKTKQDLETTHYYSVDSGLQVGTETAVYLGPSKIITKSLFSDFREVGGVKFPYTSKLIYQQGVELTIKLDKIEVNPTLEEKVFDLPDEIQALVKKDEKEEEKE